MDRRSIQQKRRIFLAKAAALTLATLAFATAANASFFESSGSVAVPPRSNPLELSPTNPVVTNANSFFNGPMSAGGTYGGSIPSCGIFCMVGTGTSSSSGGGGYFANPGYDAGRLIVRSPNNGEAWAIGTAHAIVWDSTSPSPTVDIYLETYYACRDTYPPCMVPQALPYTIARRVPNTGTFNWNIGVDADGRQIAPGQYKAFITATTPGVADASDRPFSVVAQGSTQQPTEARFISPAGDEQWFRGSSHELRWTGIQGPVSIYLVNWAGCPMSVSGCTRPQNIALIDSGVNSSSYDWIVSDAAFRSPFTFGTPASEIYQIVVSNGRETAASRPFTIYSAPQCLRPCPNPPNGYHYVADQNAINACSCGVLVPDSPFPATNAGNGFSIFNQGSAVGGSFFR